jgi:carbamate kinase
LATEIGANLLLILTDVDHAYLNYGSPEQKKLEKITLSKLEEYYEEGQFPPGSMGPKVLAVMRFLKNGGDRAVITSLDRAWEGSRGEFGTQVMKKF